MLQTCFLNYLQLKYFDYILYMGTFTTIYWYSSPFDNQFMNNN